MQKAFSILDLFVNSCIVGMHTGPEKIFSAVYTHFFLNLIIHRNCSSDIVQVYFESGCGC